MSTQIARTQSFLKKQANRMNRVPTRAEQKMKEILDRNRINYTQQSIKFRKGVLRIFDFYIPKPYKIAIEVDGLYHDPKVDSAKDWAAETKLGITTIRFKNEDVLYHPDEVEKSLLLFLKAL